MTWSYDTALTAAKDQVRLLIGDTDTNDQQLQNEEIAFFLSQHGNSVYPAAIAAARALLARYARLVDTTVDDVSERASQIRDGYRDLVASLQAQQLTAGVMPFAGGISISQKQVADEDTDRVPPIFTRDAQVVSPSTPFSGGDDR